MRYAALLATTLLAVAPAIVPAAAQQQITVHPRLQPAPGQGETIVIPPLNNPNYLDPGPAPYVPGSGHSQDYMNQAGGNSLGGVGIGIGGDVDADLLPDSDSVSGW